MVSALAFPRLAGLVLPASRATYKGQKQGHTMSNKDRVKAMLDCTAEIVRANPEAKIYNVTHAVHELAKLARSLHSRYEAACSYDWACTDKYEKRTDKLEAQAEALAADIGVTIGFQRDPRGWPMIIKAGSTEVE